MQPTDACPTERQATEVKFSPGGDKISVRYRNAPDLDWVKQRIAAVKGVVLRPGEHNPLLQNARDNKVEIQLMSKGDQLMDGLRQALRRRRRAGERRCARSGSARAPARSSATAP